ncbi:hypothetical protein HNP52_001806 [Sphingomonas kyeonggiensis]|uniref:Uncharacterized protein n=1 Tax=Sphingomonas kyeonggiensis TaxID=1268553 RepID=A0A7W7K122_9SPHN|nr:hypothetical protein [Sphingomonas kyeonggiensis]MBB4838737.1 hypothetical protein [Sphingomonas kyeonggiensis]
MNNRSLPRSIALLAACASTAPALATELPQSTACTAPPRAAEKRSAASHASLLDEARRTGAGNFLGRGLIPTAPGDARAGKPSAKAAPAAAPASRPGTCPPSPER